MGIFGPVHGWDGGKRAPPSIKPVTHILRNLARYTLPKEDSEKI